MQLWLCPILAFLLGSIPFGFFIARAKGIDIRQHGSGNIGATNVFRVIGKKYGLICLFLDALKGFVPVVLAVNLIRIEGRDLQIPLHFLDSLAMVMPVGEQFTAQLVHVCAGLLAILGHNYSPWIGFKGGKGIATSAGVLVALMPAAVAILVLIFIITLFATRYVAVASMVCAAALPVLTHFGARFHGRWDDGSWNKPLFFFTVIIGILAIWKHRSNVNRLFAGTESRFNWRSKKA
ncbi:MAG: glycerol-3-phosphate 1-O-acyltransferase PlsY [Akkermansiaceae bacterium]